MSAAQGLARRLSAAKSMRASRSRLSQAWRKTTAWERPEARVEGETPAAAARASSVGNRPRQSPISASSRAARTVPARGRLRKMCASACSARASRSEEHTSELQSHLNLVCRLLLEKKKKKRKNMILYKKKKKKYS